jgi:hypothetical protein
MYRIYFNPKTARFEIQVLIYCAFWQHVKGMSFETLTQAENMVAEIGLDKLYANKSADQFRKHMATA